MKKKKIENVAQITSSPLANGDVLITALCEDGSIWSKRLFGIGELDQSGNQWECINASK